jgi:hypothetical protein
MFVSVIVATICIVLLLNRTSPNPTYRRYSSIKTIATSDTTNPKTVGDSGEAALAIDSKLPNNNDADQKQCICGSPARKPPSCNSCAIYYSGITASFRIPDFMNEGLILESKNRVVLDADDHDLLNQLADFSTAATLSHRQLWIYTRVDTQVDDAYYQLAKATGGDVVPYFTRDGLPPDPVDAGSLGSLAASGMLVGLCFNTEVRYRRQRMQNRTAIPVRPVRVDPPPTRPAAVPPSAPPPSSPLLNSPHPPAPPNPIDETMDALNRASESAKHTRNRID